MHLPAGMQTRDPDVPEPPSWLHYIRAHMPSVLEPLSGLYRYSLVDWPLTHSARNTPTIGVCCYQSCSLAGHSKCSSINRVHSCPHVQRQPVEPDSYADSIAI